MISPFDECFIIAGLVAVFFVIFVVVSLLTKKTSPMNIKNKQNPPKSGAAFVDMPSNLVIERPIEDWSNLQGPPCGLTGSGVCNSLSEYQDLDGVCRPRPKQYLGVWGAKGPCIGNEQCPGGICDRYGECVIPL